MLLTHAYRSAVSALLRRGFEWQMLFVIPLLAVHASIATALQPRVVPHAPICANCEVTMERLLTLGSDGVDLVSVSTVLARDSRGRYYGTAFGNRQVIVWDSTGKYFNMLGSAGEGPGEFKGSINSILVGPGDSIFVLDGQLRLSVFSPRLTFARVERMPAAVKSIAILPNSGLMVRADIPTSESGGFPLHFLAPDGKVLRSFGSDAATSAVNTASADRSFFVLAGDGASMWLHRADHYSLSQRLISGERGAELDLSNVPWFKAAPPREPLSRDELRTYMNARTSPSQRVRDSVVRALDAHISTVELAGADPRGLLWVFAVGYTGARGDIKQSLLEIIDPIRGVKVLSKTAAIRFDRFLPNSMIAYSRELDTDGVARIVLWRVGLRGYSR